MQGFLQKREQEVRRCTERLRALIADRSVLDQAQDRAHENNARIDKAREDAPKLEQQLHEQAPLRAYDMEVQTQQRAIEQDRARGLDRGRGMRMNF
jgi:hypothetical protein